MLNAFINITVRTIMIAFGCSAGPLPPHESSGCFSTVDSYRTAVPIANPPPPPTPPHPAPLQHGTQIICKCIALHRCSRGTVSRGG